MIINKRFETVSVIILILASIFLSACFRSPETEVTKNDPANQSTAILNNDNVSVNPPNTPAPVGNTVSAQGDNSPTAPVGGNTSAVTANRKPQPSAKEPAPQIGTGGIDMFLFTQVRGALSSDKELADAVIVEIQQGVVTLTGNVSSGNQKAKAEQLVQSVQGVKSVKNNLRVSKQ